MDAHDLARWTRFAAKGGIGLCTAVVDCIAREMGEDLMFLKDDEITVLMQLPEPGSYLGHCEGVVGRFAGKDVHFHGKLKKPVMAKRASVGVPIAPAEGRTSAELSTSRSSPIRDAAAGIQSRHAKPPQMATSTSGASVFSVGSASVYSEASTATSVDSTTSNRTMSSSNSDETEKDIPGEPDHGNVQANGLLHSDKPASSSDTPLSTSTIASVSSSVSPSTSDTDSSLASTSSSVSPSFGSVGSISELESKRFDTTKPLETQTSFVLAPPPLKLGSGTITLPSPIVAPLRVSKSPRTTLSPGLPPSSPLPMPPTVSGEIAWPTSFSPALPSPLSPGKPALSPRPPASPSLAFPGSLTPGLPGSLTPGQRSPGLPGSLSPGFRFGKARGPDAQSPYTFSAGSGANTPAPAPSPYAARSRSSSNENKVSIPLNVRMPPLLSSPYGTSGAPLSPPPSSPLPPLPSAALPSPAFPAVGLPTPVSTPPIGTAATAAASGRMSPLTVLSSSLPSSTSRTPYADGQHDRDGVGASGEVEEGDTTHLSTLDAFRRQLDDSADEDNATSSEEEGVRIPCLRKTESRQAARRSVDEVDDVVEEEEEEDEEAHSDGEVGIGLSLMGELGSDDEEDDSQGTRNKASNDGDSEENVGVVANGSTAPLAWTCYTPTSPVSIQSPNGHHPPEEDGDEEQEDEDEDEDEGAYWDDIYDDYRYSRYSLGSKRFSTISKASGASKTSSKARANVPPMPIPTDRPSLESTSSAVSVSIQSSRPSLTRTASDDSTHATHSLPLTAQFPAVPMHVPVRTESRLRIVHDGFMQDNEDHGQRELQIMHESTEESVVGVGLNIEVTEEDDERDEEVDEGRQLTSVNANMMALSPLLHTRFGSPHSSRFTDFEDGSDQDHGRRYSNRSGKSILSSVEGPLRLQVDGGGMTSSSMERTDTDHASSPDIASSPIATTPSNDPSSSEDPGLRMVAVEGSRRVTGTNNIVDDPVLATELPSPLPASTTQSTSVAQKAAATDPAQIASPVDPSEDATSPFLRPRPQPGGGQSPHPFARTSMFLPHPNAPKVHHPSPGPMYGRTTPQVYAYPDSSRQFPPTPPGTTFFSMHILHQLHSLSSSAPQGLARRPPMTLFARCQPELSTSMIPVPILFSLDPFPALPIRPEGHNVQTKVGGSKWAPYPASMIPTRAATVSVPVRRGGNGVVPPSEGRSGPLLLPRQTAMPPTDEGDQQEADLQSPPSSAPSFPIPRERFVPQAGAARPRSRSFSSFGAHIPVSTPQETSQEEPAIRVQSTASIIAPPRKGSHIPAALMARHAPSPLLLQAKNKDRELNGVLGSPPAVLSPAFGTQFRVLANPFAQEPLTSVDVTRAINGNGPVTSPSLSSPFTKDSDRDKDVSPLSGLSERTSETLVLSLDASAATSPHLQAPGRQESLDVPMQIGSSERAPRKSSDSSGSRSLTSPPPIPDPGAARSLTQDFPLKNKLSLPALRMKGSIKPNKVDDAISIVSMAVSGENETVQVQDMDFELVKPAIPQVTPLTGRASEESTLTSRDLDAGRPEASPILGDTASMVSSAPKSPLVPTPPASAAAPTESPESIDAHRQRESRWMSLFSAIPPSQARKNKKVRKLLQEGVPSSVRYLAWCRLTDSKARALPGVYAKLCKRPPVPAFAEIVKDAAEGFPDQPQLHTAKGPLVSLLQAYLSMVPDIQYDCGLTLIAGRLLLLAPEEDAFWIFASMMDAHLRTYFAANAIQVEIDASLFSKALEIIDPVLTKKLYVQLSIAPASITRPWFSTLFVRSLSVDHLDRVWDIFLYDGIPYLFRVGLVVINCVRHLLLQATTEEAALAYLIRPPPACLPSAAELLIMAANLKLKDDDIRKQRVKMEQQLKRTTQVRPPNGLSGVQTTAISLPKT